MAGTCWWPKTWFLFLGMLAFTALRPGNAAGQAAATPSSTAGPSPIQSAYALPPDAQVIDGDFSDGDILIKARFKIHDLARINAKDVTQDGWLRWGISTEFPGWPTQKLVGITADLAERLGLNFELAKKWGMENGIWISDDHNSEMGPVRIQIDLGHGVTWMDLPMVATEHFDESFKDMNQTRQGDDRVVGLLPYGLLAQYLFSLDYQNQKIYLRPLDASRRTFFDKKPIKEASYKGSDDIYLPVTVNQKVNGYAILTTESDSTYAETPGNEPVTSYRIGGFDFMKYDPGLKPSVSSIDMQGWVLPQGVTVVAWLENDFLRDFFVTVDPRNQKIYFEKP